MKFKQKELFKYDLDIFKPLIGSIISGIHFMDDFRICENVGSTFNPLRNQFEGIQNLVIWYYRGNQHYTLRLYTVDNGRFVIVDDKGYENLSYYGVKSIGTKSNIDLKFGKRGSISLKYQNGFSIEGIGEVKRIVFYQEIHQNLVKNGLNNVYPKLEDNSYFPDRILIESDSLYLIIRAEEDFDQNLVFKCKVGIRNKNDAYYSSGYNDKENFEIITLDELY